MRPDDMGPTRLASYEGSVPGSDPELTALAERLSTAGERARAAERDPRPAFADELRARLVGPAVTIPTSGTALATVAGERFPARPVVPRIVTRTPTFLPAPRWTAFAIAAALVVSLIGLGSGRLFQLTRTPQAGDVAGATLARAGTVSPLAAGMELREGDVIRTEPDGRATLELGGGIARLAGSTGVRLVTLSSSELVLDQLAGRVYHRVTGSTITYRVLTADIAWTADGTAFDIRREPDPSGGERARVVGVEHDVDVSGTGLLATLDAGDVAIVHLGSRVADASTDIAIEPATGDDLGDPWLLQNARDDVALGFEPGILGPLLAKADPSPSGSTRMTAPGDDDPSAAPMATDQSGPSAWPPSAGTPEASPDPTPNATSKPSAKPTAEPTPKPTPTPTPSPALGSLGLTVTACPGAFTTLAWSEAPATGFHHYQTIRSSSSSIPVVWPPVGPALAPAGLYGTDRSWLSAIDSGLEVGTNVSYRTIAFTVGGSATAASDVRTVRARAVAGLGGLAVVPDGGRILFDWTPFDGQGACFTSYKIVMSATSESPSYLDGAAEVWGGGDRAVSSALIDPLDPGTYHFRLQVLRTSEAGTLLVAQTDAATLVVP